MKLAKLSAATVSACVIFSLAAVGGTPASAATPDTTAEPSSTTMMSGDLIANQEVLFEYADWVSSQPDFVKNGFIALSNEAQTLSTKLLWESGKEANTQILLKKAADLGISTTVVSQETTLSDIDKSIAEINLLAEDALPAGYEIDVVKGLQADFDGVEVVLKKTDINFGNLSLLGSNFHIPEATVATVTDAQNEVADKLSSIPANLKVSTIQTTESAVPAATRGNDSPRFHAGAVMMSSSGGMCTSGFSIIVNGVAKTTTARHCTATPYKSPGSGYSFGYTYTTSHAGLARVMNSAGRGRTWDGAWNDSSGFSKAVSGYRDVSLGDYVCTDGANSGVHCNVKVTAMKVAWDDGLGGGPANNILAVKQSSGIAAIQGDSGGPVIFPYSTGKVGAVGMIQGIRGTLSTGSACGSGRFLGSNKCSKEVFFTSSRTMVSSIPGARLATE